jgi:D-alanyl-D-alanine carboxypeptidase
MRFDTGSAGKILLAALVVDLAYDGLVSLDEPIDRYLDLSALPEVSPQIIVRQLLNHTSGLYDMVSHPGGPFRVQYDEIEFEKWWTTEEIFTELGGPPAFPPGEGWQYTQAGYQLAAMIVEDVTGNGVADEVQRRLLDPLDIDGMRINDTQPWTGGAVAHHWLDTDRDGTLEDVSDRSLNWIASLSRILVYSSASDFAAFGHALFTGEVLHPDSLQAMVDFVPLDPAVEAPLMGYGLGVMVFTPEIGLGNAAYGHLGSIPGYRCALVHLPEQEMTIVVMTNSGGDEEIGVIFAALLAAALDRDQAPDSDAGDPLPAHVVPLASAPADARVISAFAPEALFCEHRTHWQVAATAEDWIDISLEWVVANDATLATAVWPHHTHTVVVGGQELPNLDAHVHDVVPYTAKCPDGELELWAKGLSIVLPPLPPGTYQVRWYSEITEPFNNGFADYKRGNYMEFSATLTVR